jgi:quercetin dioxygenase-like cupin family protein
MSMKFVDTAKLEVIERKPGWYGRFFQSPHMTFAHYDFTQGSSVHEHFHPQEEVWQVIEGTLEVTVDGVVQIAGPGMAAIVLPTCRTRSRP